MKKLFLIFFILYLITLSINISVAQKNISRINNKLVIKIMPVKKVFLENDTAFFKITFKNKTDSIITISKHPSLYAFDNFDMYPSCHSEDIYTFILKQNKRHIYKPYLFSISDDNWYEPDHRKQDSILHEEKISISVGGSLTLQLDLFPFKGFMSTGKYYARIAFFLNNERPYILIKSNWTNFIFEKSNEK